METNLSLDVVEVGARLAVSTVTEAHRYMYVMEYYWKHFNSSLYGTQRSNHRSHLGQVHWVIWLNLIFKNLNYSLGNSLSTCILLDSS